jgi:hypothetical protein
MTTELETRSDAVSGTVRPTSYSGSGSHPGFPEWGRPSETRLYVTSGATETCFTRFLFVSENTNCFYNPIRLIDQNQNRIMEAYNMNIKNHRNIRTPGSGGMSCT